MLPVLFVSATSSMSGGRVYRFNTGPLLNAEAATYVAQSLAFSEQSDPEIPCPPLQIADAANGL